MTQNNSKQQRKLRHKTHATLARLAALEVVRQVRMRKAFAQDVIAKVIDNSAMPARERAFATLLALGCVSSRGTLDEVINRALNSKNDVLDDTRDALQVSTYEIVFLKKEAHAAVDQGVELVRSFCPAACRVANAVLRKIVCLAAKFPFGNPSEDVLALARLHAFPTWLAKGLIEAYGLEVATRFMQTSNEQAPIFIGVNVCKASIEDVTKTFECAKEILHPVSLNDKKIFGSFRLTSSHALLKPQVKTLLDEGKILVSDAAAQYIVQCSLPDKKPKSILEIGSGRATKTILIQSNAQKKYGSQVENYVAIDNHKFKTQLLKKRSKAYGINVKGAITANACDLEQVLHGETFDFVFLDAPCTGLGTLRRHPEIRWRINPENIADAAKLQLNLLLSAAGCVSGGGVLVYSTCTVTLQENVGVVQAFLSSSAGKNFSILPVCGHNTIATSLSHGSFDAHFAAVFLKNKN